MKIAIHGRKFSEAAKPYVQQVFDTLLAKNAAIQLSDSFCGILKEANIDYNCDRFYSKNAEIFDADLVLSLGGDGTFLETLSHVAAREIPMMGINFGRLGFLATTDPKNVESAITSIVEGKFTIDERMLIQAEAENEGFDTLNFALNEIAITKTDTSSMIVIHTFIDGEFLNSYWADGLMVSTPTGSTGYSLSCGGPVVLPHSANFIITPICPHNLFVRPMIVSDQSTVTLRVESRSKNYLVALDARAKVISEEQQFIKITKGNFKAKLVKTQGDNFLNTLRTKLNWGIDARN
jgi:NAD+ kinase